MPQRTKGIGILSSGGTWQYSISWGSAEANSYTDSTHETRWLIDRICATYINVASDGELLQSVSDDQNNASHAEISAKSVYVFATKKGRYIFEKSGFETLDTTLVY